MRLTTFAFIAQALHLTSLTLARVVPATRDVSSREHLDSCTRQISNASCTNGPNTRACWYDGYSVATDFDDHWPTTGRIVTYDLEITNTTLAPDGVERLVFAVNGQYPGPTLYADWGDTLVVNVKNSMESNGTSMHWHGLRQLNTNQMDGVNGVTECPLAPGKTKQYVFNCTQHGTSWYHSHHSVQYADGVLGAIVINGPATANYDEDLGTMTFTDWYYTPAFALNQRQLHTVGAPPLPNTGLINGTMISMVSMNGTTNGTSSAVNGTKGAYQVTHVDPGKRYRLRLINTGVDNHFHVSIDNHNLTVITADFTPIKPYTTSSVSIAIGQRYDVIINANQAVDNYWIRANVATSCAKNAMAGKIMGILRYNGAPTINPTTTNSTAISTLCYDEQVTPYVENSIPIDQFDSAMERFVVDFNLANLTTGGNLVQWFVNNTAIDVNWGKPTLGQVVDFDNTTFNPMENVFDIATQKDAWTFWVIDTIQGDPIELAHPIHLHGHDFYVLGSGTGIFNGDKSKLNFANPIRRDTMTQPASGWAVIGFPADNPGIWVMHCHIAWHVAAGFSMQFLESASEIADTIGDLGDFDQVCLDWNAFYNGPDRVYVQDDSGL